MIDIVESFRFDWDDPRPLSDLVDDLKARKPDWAKGLLVPCSSESGIGMKLLREVGHRLDVRIFAETECRRGWASWLAVGGGR